jgi:hypothetical protein
MFHPVGSHPASVYWRRRLLLLTAVVILIAVSAWVLRPGGAKPQAKPPAKTHTSTSNAALNTTPASTPTTNLTTAGSTHVATGSTTSPTNTTSGTPTACLASQLKVAAVAGQAHYQVGDHPQLLLQVTNNGTTPCVQDLADSQVELRVYNGESRVWGSHDCQVEPGTNLQTLPVGRSVRVSIIWSGLSSQPKCAGTRQRVGAGTYTLYALLSGHTGTAAQFSIS